MKMRHIPLRFGYTIHDLDRIARTSIHGTGRVASNWAERYEVARGAVAEALYASADPISRDALIYAGRDAIWKWLHQERHGQGLATARRGGGTMHRYAMYWRYHPVQASHEDKVVNRMAMEQVLSVVPPDLRQALAAVAEHGSAREAARRLGVPTRTFAERVAKARELIQRLLLGGESPVNRRRQPRRPDAELQPCGTKAAYFRHRRRGESQDQDCIDAWRRYRAERARYAGDGGQP